MAPRDNLSLSVAYGGLPTKQGPTPTYLTRPTYPLSHEVLLGCPSVHCQYGPHLRQGRAALCVAPPSAPDRRQVGPLPRIPAGEYWFSLVLLLLFHSDFIAISLMRLMKCREVSGRCPETREGASPPSSPPSTPREGAAVCVQRLDG